MIARPIPFSPPMVRATLDALAKDGPRYRALGNSKAVPVVRWIGERIQAVEEIVSRRSA